MFSTDIIPLSEEPHLGSGVFASGINLSLDETLGNR